MTSWPETQLRRAMFLDGDGVIVVKNQIDAYNERGSSSNLARDGYIITGRCLRNYSNCFRRSGS